jgi:hypothetical protein
MAKLKIASINNGTQTDRFVSPTLISGNYIGGTGGLTSLSTNTIQPTVKIGSAAAAAGSIILQKGMHKFRVTDGTNTGTCTLVNLATPTVANTMSIVVTKSDASTFRASRITNKFVYDFAGNKYRYWFAAATTTFVSVANA